MPTSAEDQVYQLLNGFRASQVVALAVELGLPDLVGEGSNTARALADATGSDVSSIQRLLHGLAALGVFEEDEEGRFHETPLSACLRSGQPGYALSRMMVQEGYLAWARFADSARTGRPVYEAVHGLPYFKHLAQKPDAATRFNAAMAAMAEVDGKALSGASNLADVGTIVDVGGGRAALMAAVLAANPAMQGVVFDLPSGLDGALAQLEAAGVAARCRLVEGSFFENVPAGGDAYVLRFILHDWDDRDARRILLASARAMRPKARLLVIERLVPARYRASVDHLRIAMVDLHMMVILGGRERTKEEFRTLLSAAGFRLVRTAPLPTGTWLLEAVRVANG